MKQKFSTKWKASRQPRKQRKYRINAPVHIKRKMMSANLSKEMRKKYSRRSIPLRTGDKIRIMRGQFKKKTGKIDKINLRMSKVSLEGLNKSKKDGTKIKIWFEPSNLQIQEINLDDKKRKQVLERKVKSPEENKLKENKNDILKKK